ncbi:MAG: cell division protein FtsQ/DivIB [Bacteroidia bacterium]
MSRKVNIKKLLLLILIPVVIIGLYYFATRDKDNVECKEVEINFNYKTEKPLLTEADIYKYLELPEGKKSLIGKYAANLKMNEMEQKLLKKSVIKKAEIYMSMGGKMKFDITLRHPILRVIPNVKAPYYICDDRVKIPLSSNFTPDLIPATGFMNDKIDRKLYYIVGFVNNNSFWKEQIQQFFVSENQDISFIPFTGVHEVILGDTSNLDEKFKKLEVFYKKGLSKIGWDKYKSINLKFKGQVICKQ